jgi:hypothetical protein
LYVYLQAARNEEAVREALSNQLNNGIPQNFAKAVRSVVYPPVDPADAPPEPPKKVMPISQRTTLTEVRRNIRSAQLNLSVMGPLDVVPDARPVLREFAQWLIEWAGQWSEGDVSVTE